MSDTQSPSAVRTDLAVGIGLPCGPTIPWQTALALAKTTHAAPLLGVPMNIHVVAGSSLVTVARNRILDQFLAAKSEQFLFWIDSDIVWEPEDFFRVLALAKHRGIVCGAYPIKREPEEAAISFVDATPVIASDGCVQVTSLGLGFTCIRRDILQQFAQTKQQVYHPGNDVFITDAFRLDTIEQKGVLTSRGEDGAFFADLRALGNSIWLDTNAHLGHVGSKEYRIPLNPQGE
jgi:hypothetical protein